MLSRPLAPVFTTEEKVHWSDAVQLGRKIAARHDRPRAAARAIGIAHRIARSSTRIVVIRNAPASVRLAPWALPGLRPPTVRVSPGKRGRARGHRPDAMWFAISRWMGDAHKPRLAAAESFVRARAASGQDALHPGQNALHSGATVSVRARGGDADGRGALSSQTIMGDARAHHPSSSARRWPLHQHPTCSLPSSCALVQSFLGKHV